jgi:hypothetical protein
MNNLKSTVIALCALLLPALSLAASDMYLKIDDIKGESQVVGCANGACVVPPLSAGNYRVWIVDAQGTVIPSDATLKYAVVGPRDAISGQASGKRMHQALTITKTLGRGMAPGNVITVGEDGSQLAIGRNDEAVASAQAKIGKSRSNIQNN